MYAVGGDVRGNIQTHLCPGCEVPGETITLPGAGVVVDHGQPVQVLIPGLNFPLHIVCLKQAFQRTHLLIAHYKEIQSP